MKTTHLILLACVTCIATALAVDPPPDGGYPNRNTAEGEDALLVSGQLSDNTAIGYHAIYSEQYGGANTAVGTSALELLYDAVGNTAVGSLAMSANTNSSYNTAVGYGTLGGIVSYSHSMNTAVGYRAMALADTFGCTAIGFQALLLSQGTNNVAVGSESLNQNSTGLDNTAVGWRSLFGNLLGYSNVGIGTQALFYNQTGNQNIALGQRALLNKTVGSDNIAIGASAGINLTSGDNNIIIGSGGVAGDSGVIRLGTLGTHKAFYAAGILSSPLATATGVGITTDGQLGIRPSSARYKEAIEPINASSETILSLRPVKFRYKKNLDPKGIPQFGLVAEEVAKVDPDLVVRDTEGKPYTVRYEAVNAMLLNEFLKEHKKVEEQGKEIAELRAALAKQAEALQKVSARLETSVPAERLVENR